MALKTFFNVVGEQMIKILKRAGVSALLTSLVLGVMWVSYFFVNYIAGTYGMGVHPRSVGLSEIFGVISSWAYHGSWNHIMANSVGLLTLLPFVGFFEKKPFKVTFLLILLSGFFTWVFGAANTNHIGASGLIFALIGYIAAAGTIGGKFRYLIPLLLSGTSYWYSVKMGLIPQESVSFAGHFGGLIAGFILGFLIPKMQREQDEKDEALVSQYIKSGSLNNVQKKKWYQFWKKKNNPLKVDWNNEIQKMKEQQLDDIKKIKERQKMKMK